MSWLLVCMVTISAVSIWGLTPRTRLCRTSLFNYFWQGGEDSNCLQVASWRCTTYTLETWMSLRLSSIGGQCGACSGARAAWQCLKAFLWSLLISLRTCSALGIGQQNASAALWMIWTKRLRGFAARLVWGLGFLTCILCGDWLFKHGAYLTVEMPHTFCLAGSCTGSYEVQAARPSGEEHQPHMFPRGLCCVLVSRLGHRVASCSSKSVCRFSCTSPGPSTLGRFPSTACFLSRAQHLSLPFPGGSPPPATLSQCFSTEVIWQPAPSTPCWAATSGTSPAGDLDHNTLFRPVPSAGCLPFLLSCLVRHGHCRNSPGGSPPYQPLMQADPGVALQHPGSSVQWPVPGLTISVHYSSSLSVALCCSALMHQCSCLCLAQTPAIVLLWHSVGVASHMEEGDNEGPVVPDPDPPRKRIKTSRDYEREARRPDKRTRQRLRDGDAQGRPAAPWTPRTPRVFGGPHEPSWPPPEPPSSPHRREETSTSPVAEPRTPSPPGVTETDVPEPRTPPQSMPMPLHILSDEEQAPEAPADQTVEVEGEGDPLPAAETGPPPLSEVSSGSSPCQVKLEQTMTSSVPSRSPLAAPKPKKMPKAKPILGQRLWRPRRLSMAPPVETVVDAPPKHIKGSVGRMLQKSRSKGRRQRRIQEAHPQTSRPTS